MNVLSRFGWFVLAIGFVPLAVASDTPCESCPQPVSYQRTCVADDSQPSWVFRRSAYTHDPETGARVAQYQRIAPVEPLEDERNVTSRYRRIRTNLRGTDGSIDSTNEVQAWGNGRGGIDAEWERFHDAWKESYLQNGYYNQNGNNWNGNGWNGNGWNGNGWNGNGPWNGGGWNGGGPWNGGGNWGPGNGGPPGPWQNNGGPHGGNGGPHGNHGPNGGPHGNHGHNGNGS
jgi:hypothetical protein